jgi:hypothetical protein
MSKKVKDFGIHQTFQMDFRRHGLKRPDSVEPARGRFAPRASQFRTGRQAVVSASRRLPMSKLFHLFEPVKLGHKTLRNRIVFGAHTANMAEDGSQVRAMSDTMPSAPWAARR